MSAELVIQQGPVKIYELLGSGDERRIEAMLTLYANLFPQYSHYLPRMRARAKRPCRNDRGHIVHYWLVEVDGKPAGFRTFRYIPHRRCGLAVTLAIDPDFRKIVIGEERLAVFVMYRCLDQIIEDAISNGGPPALGMVNEVESPRLMEHYIRNGLIELPVKYVEPIFSTSLRTQREEEFEKIEFEPMHLGFLANPELDTPKFTWDILTDFVLAFLVDHYGIPEEHPDIQSVLQSIPIMN